MDSPYARNAPSTQQTLDLFKGKWATRMPASMPDAVAGAAALFEDPRIHWAKENLEALDIRLAESTVLELGPLEGAHTHSLIKAGAKSVTAVEAHPEAFLKCLVLKELIGMERVNFLYGDAVSFLRSIGHNYDIGFACGILYHLSNPVELIELLCRRTRAVFIWTVFWDSEFSKSHPEIIAGTSGVSQRTVSGFSHTLHRHDYGGDLNYGKFWGGPDGHSNWMEGPEILGALKHFGFARQRIEFESNPNGRAILVAATR